MNVERNFAFALVLHYSRHFLNQWESKPKPIVFSPHTFFRAWHQLHAFASNSDWLVVLLTSVAIGQSNYFGFGFTTQLETALLSLYKFKVKLFKSVKSVAVVTQLNNVQFQKISILPPMEAFLFCTPSLPSGNSILASYFASKSLAFKTPSP